MSAPGVITLPQAKMAPAFLHASLVSIFGADLIGLWIGEDIAVAGTDVTSWPGRVGPTLANAGLGRYVETRIGGRKAILVADVASITTALFAAGVGVSLATMMVANTPPQPFVIGTGVEASAATLVGNNMLTTANGTSNLYSVGGQVHYIDGVETHACALGTHVFEGSLAGSVLTGVKVGQTGGAYCWRERIALGMALAAFPSAGNRAASVALLRKYYAI